MKLEDVMTTQEAAERWNVTADSLKQNCRGRVKNGFLEGEFRKSGKMWLVTRQGMERLYGEELKVCSSSFHPLIHWMLLQKVNYNRCLLTIYVMIK